MELILGSASPWRQQVLERAGYTFRIIKPNIDEKAIRRSDPADQALAIAQAKADTIIASVKKSALVITADQVVTCSKQILEKPASLEQAKAFLLGYAKSPAQTVSALVVTNSQTGQRASGVDMATIHLRPLPISLIDQLISEQAVMLCAGALCLEDERVKPYIEKLDGTLESTMGLPLELLHRLMKEVGYESA